MSARVRLQFLVLVASCLAAACSAPPIRVGRAERFDWQAAPGRRPVPVPYLLYLPDGYDDPARANERWPLVLYLRGWPIMGQDMAQLAKGALPGEAEKGRKFPFILAAPAAPGLWQGYEPRRVHDLLDHLESRLRVDPERVYLSALSRGAADSWAAAAVRPDRFAGMLLCCGWGEPWHARRSASVPVWAFHGALDFFIPAIVGEMPISAHREAGGRTCWTVLPFGTHFIWDAVFARRDVYDWLLAQRRPQTATRAGAARAPADAPRWAMPARDSISIAPVAAPAPPAASVSTVRAPAAPLPPPRVLPRR
jgi:poly(3-hydroxybutyrate) depolymerase